MKWETRNDNFIYVPQIRLSARPGQAAAANVADIMRHRVSLAVTRAHRDFLVARQFRFYVIFDISIFYSNSIFFRTFVG